MAFRFREFHVYNNARKFISEIYKVTGQFPSEEKFGLITQLRRAAISIALNIAEGSDRGSDKEFKRFVNIAIGSVNEVVAALDVALDNSFINEEESMRLTVIAEQIVKQLSSLSKKLKDS
ncbi:MAG: four helix bundle protein [Pseudomonadota bacterium]